MSDLVDVGDRYTMTAPNQTTRPNAGGPRQFPSPKPLAVQVGQFWQHHAPKHRSTPLGTRTIGIIYQRLLQPAELFRHQQSV